MASPTSFLAPVFARSSSSTTPHHNSASLPLYQQTRHSCSPSTKTRRPGSLPLILLVGIWGEFFFLLTHRKRAAESIKTKENTTGTTIPTSPVVLGSSAKDLSTNVFHETSHFSNANVGTNFGFLGLPTSLLSPPTWTANSSSTADSEPATSSLDSLVERNCWTSTAANKYFPGWQTDGRFQDFQQSPFCSMKDSAISPPFSSTDRSLSGIYFPQMCNIGFEGRIEGAGCESHSALQESPV